MKKKITALLLVCTMAVPYGTMPVYAGALNETEANVSEAYETESAETDAPEETEVYEAESDETEYVLEPEVSDYYAVQASGERTGGNINWNYPDNIIPTDKTTASDGCLLAGVKGTYLADAQNALDLINQYRKEACDNGYPDPRNSGRKLTSSDYKPIKWSSDLEYIARIRAAESSVLISHTRPNGQICFSLSSPNDIGSYGEVLAWNGSNSMLDGIKQWYGEKQYWLDQNSSEETGHYTQMIDPDNNYVGIAAFLNEKGVYYNTTSGEFTTENNLDEETASKVENCIQTIEVKKDELSGSIEGLNANAKVGDTEQAKFKLTYNDCDLQYLSGVTGAAINWSSDNEAVAKVDQNGTVTAVGAGQATITAETDCGLKASYKITVSENTEKITESDVTVGECIYTGSEIKPSVTVKHNGKTLQEGTDYTCIYTKGVQAGDTITVTVEGKGDYSGTVAKTVTIQAKSLDGNTEITIGECDYTDEGAIKEALTVRSDGKTLSKGTDYEIVSLKTTDKGSTIAIAVEIKGTGNYKGTVQKELTVSKKTEKITESDVTVGECIYTGSEIKPSVTVKHSGKTLQEGTDYTYTYTKGVQAGDTITVTVEGKGDYSGTVAKTVTIQPKSLERNTEITIGECDYTDEGAIKEALTVKSDGKTLSKGTDYEIVSLKTTDKGSTIVIAVEVKGTGNYKGTVQKELTVSKKTEKLAESDVTVGECIYTGSAIKPSVTVKHSGKTLQEGTDYTCTYTKGVQAGDTITVTVEGKGDYSGTVAKTVTIQPKSLEGNTEITIGKCDFADVDSVIGAIVVRCDGKTLTRGEDYYISSCSLSSNGYVAEINVSVEGLGNYFGTVQKDLTVTKDQKPSVYSVSIKCVSDGLSISWQSTDNADGYYIYRSCYRNNKWESWKNIKKITNGDTKTWKDNNTDSSVLYRYTVRAYNSSGMSDYNNSNIAESYFVARPTTKLSNNAKGISVSWTKSKNASGYYIYRKEKKSDGWTKVKTVDSKASSWMDNSAKSGKDYYYTVVAYRNKTRSAFDTDRTIVRLDMPSVKNANAAKGVQVKWNKISGAQSYDVYRSQYVNNAWSKWNKIAGVSSNSLSYTDGSVKEGIIYKYTVRAVKGSSMSAYESGTAIRYLSQPDFSLSGTSKGIAIKVKANKNIDGYLIYRKDSNGKWQRMTTVKADKDMTWTDSNVKRNNKYTYTVRAYKKNDLSSYHSGKSVTYKGGK